MVSSLSKRFGNESAARLYRTIALVTGEVGTGKTRFPLTGPSPHVYQSFDKGLEGTLDEVKAAGKLAAEFHPIDYDWHPGTNDFTQKYAQDLRDEFISDYEFALDNGARLITWDKENDIWELFRYAEFGAPNADQPRNYAKLNQRYTALVNKVKSYDCSLVMIDGMRSPWKMGPKGLIKTSERERRGFDTLDELVFVEMNFRREAGEFHIDVGKCRQNSALQDQTLSKDDMPGGEIDFASVGQLLMPGSTAEDWR